LNRTKKTKQRECKSITLFGGEPLLKENAKLIDYITEEMHNQKRLHKENIPTFKKIVDNIGIAIRKNITTYFCRN